MNQVVVGSNPVAVTLDICEISKNTFFNRTAPVAASVLEDPLP